MLEKRGGGFIYPAKWVDQMYGRNKEIGNVFDIFTHRCHVQCFAYNVRP